MSRDRHLDAIAIFYWANVDRYAAAGTGHVAVDGDHIERLTPVAERLGCAEELHSITTIIDRGVPYQRLKRVLAQTGSLTEVTRSLTDDLRNSYR